MFYIEYITQKVLIILFLFLNFNKKNNTYQTYIFKSVCLIKNHNIFILGSTNLTKSITVIIIIIDFFCFILIIKRQIHDEI